MFAIVDIETTGGKAETSKITEICILVHDGLTVVDKFSTLINPECRIPQFITNLTGITNSMVENAPKFYEVAKQILEFTRDKVFVAHNVGFDYGFIQAEFASLGYQFKREKLCTVRLSRKLLPKRISYSLGNLCESLGIENDARHRAEGDAVATAKLFDILLQLKSQNPQYKNKGIDEINTTRIDKIKKYILDKIPEECGVYYFLNREQEIIYIGKSTNMYNRAVSHFNTKESKGKKMLNDLYNVDFVKTGSELIALLLEAEEIKKHKPKYNRQRKASVFSHCIDWFEDENRIINFHIVPYEESKNPLQAYVHYASAREKLESWMDEHALCLAHCGLTPKGSSCFNHQLKKCRGICSENESVNDYNKRAAEVVKSFKMGSGNFMLLDKGRMAGEKSLILVENGKYAGYGFADESLQVSDPEELKSIITRANYYPDTDDLLRGWIRQNKGVQRIKI
ncbi:MAG TPA: exonuclease domain-containing protein [Flavobacteriales bacterium]|nr:exonuclease domain-containing protein [Flavobacteriales bacterium]